jgi:hypothetical protein
MKLTYPGGFLTFLMVLTFVGVGAAVYLGWGHFVWFIVFMAFCHVLMLFRIRAGAWILAVVYALGIVLWLVKMATSTPVFPPTLRSILRLAFNVCVILELRNWLRTRGAVEPQEE